MRVAFYQILDPAARREALFMTDQQAVKNYTDEYRCIYGFDSSKKLKNEDQITAYLEYLFMSFQDVKPKDYHGTSLSQTDIIVLEGHGSYYCKTIGWEKVSFSPNRKGLLITLEGIDGCGKSSVLKMIKESFDDPRLLFLREPGSTQISEKIRLLLQDTENEEMNPWCEAYLYAASRAQLVQEVIKPALMKKRIVIVDRFIDSSLIYQGIGRGCGVQEIKELNKRAMDGIKPDLTIYLDCPAEVAASRRRAARNEDRIESESIEFFEKLRQGYLNLVKSKNRKFMKIDATQSLEKIKEELSEILEEVL